MAYTEPGVTVIQQLQAAAANVAEAQQVPTFAGPMYEVFDDQVHTQAYDALTGAGGQVFTWPGKKTSSIVDLAGVRKSIGEVDAQLVEYAEYPLTWRLRDPITQQSFDIDPLTDVEAISQSGFTVIESSAAASARAAGAVAIAAANRELFLEAGGLISAHVSAGDRVRLAITTPAVLGTVTLVQDDRVFFTPDGHDLTVKTAAIAGAVTLVATGSSTVIPTSGTLLLGAGDTLELVAYSADTISGQDHTLTVGALLFDHAAGEAVAIRALDAASLSSNLGDMTSEPGYVTLAAGGLTGFEGRRVVMWVDGQRVIDGALTTGVAAAGSLTALAKAALANNDNFTIGDGYNTATTFEFKVTGGFVAVAGRVTVDISALTTNVEVADAMRTAITGIGAGLRITPDAPGTALIDLTNDVEGTVGNVAITELLAVGTLTPVGMIGGVDEAIQPGGLVVTSVNVGGKITFWSKNAGEGMTALGTGTVASDLYMDVGTPFAATDVGRYIKLTVSAVDYIVRIIGYTSSSIITLAPGVPDGAATPAGLMYGQQVRTIKAVDPDTGDVLVDGTIAATATDIPLVLHTPVARQLVTDTLNSDTQCRYQGSAVPSEFGDLYKVPFAFYDADLDYEIFPAYELLATYRALDVSSVNVPLGVYAPTDLIDAVKANPLMWAAKSALTAMGTTDRLVLLMPVDLYADVDPKTGYPEDQDEAQGYIEALEILERKDAAYFLVPLTRNATVRDAFKAHVLALSEPCCKSERVTYATYPLPLGALESTTGIVASGLDGGNKKIVDEGQNFLSQHHLIAGNTVLITAPAAIAGTYAVGVGTTEDELVLDGADWTQTAEFTVTDGNFNTTPGQVTTAVTEAFKDVEVGDYLIKGTATRRITAVTNGYKTLTYAGVVLTGTAQTLSVLRTHVGVRYHANPYTKSQQADALKAIAEAVGSRRVINMWPDVCEQVTGTSAQGTEVRELLPSWFAAAAEAGRDSVIPPQRSSTGAALAGFTGLDHSNAYFNKTQLNTLAGGGWAILEQRVEGGSVTMRHLLTTDMSTVKTQELAFTKNVDNMAKRKRASMEPLLNDDKGRVNITKQFLSALAIPAQSIYDTFVKDEQLVQTENTPPYKILSIRQDTTAPDTILEDAELNIPLPANKVTVTFVI